MGEARLDLRGTEEDRVIEGLIVFLTERAKGAVVSTLPGDVGSKVASTCVHLVNASIYKTRKASEGVRSETGMIQICRGYCRSHNEPVGK